MLAIKESPEQSEEFWRAAGIEEGAMRAGDLTVSMSIAPTPFADFAAAIAKMSAHVSAACDIPVGLAQQQASAGVISHYQFML